MGNTINEIRVFTVDLASAHREALEMELERSPEVVVEHHPGWVFSMAHADVVVVEEDSGTGKEALDMLRMFQGDRKAPCVVMYTDDGEGAGATRSARSGKEDQPRAPEALCRRIEQVLGQVRHRMVHERVIPETLPDVLHI